jgi:hypothetical protein
MVHEWLEKLFVSEFSQEFSPLKRLSFLPCSQNPPTLSYPQPLNSTNSYKVYLYSSRFKIILPSDIFTLCFPTEILHECLIRPVNAAGTSHSIIYP